MSFSLRENIQVEQLQPAAGAGDAAGVPRGALRHAGPRPALLGPGGAAQSGTDTIHHQPSRDWESYDIFHLLLFLISVEKFKHP